MRLLAAIVKKEILQHVRSFRFIAVALIMLALTALAAFVGTDDYLQRLETYRQQIELSADELESITVYSYLQPIVAREPEPLSVFDRGVEGRLESSVRVNLYTIPTVSEGGSKLLAWSRDLDIISDLDLTMIVRLVLGLLALLLVFDAVIGENERGTLKLLLAHDLRRSTAIVGKYLGAFLSVLIPLVLGLGLTVSVLLERGSLTLDALHWQRLAVLLAAYLAYLSAMCAIGLILSMTARSTSSALVVALFAWLAIVFLLPQVATQVVHMARGEDRQQLEDLVSRLEAERDTEIGQPPRSADGSRLHVSPYHLSGLTGMEGATLRRYGTARIYDALMFHHRNETQVARHFAEKIFAAKQNHKKDLRRLEDHSIALSRLSPAFLLERLAETFAGTSLADHERFLEETREYRSSLIAYLERKGAFDDWRWFTDEVIPRPWYEYVLAMRPEEVELLDGATLMERFSSASSEIIKERDNNDLSKILNVGELTPFEGSSPRLGEILDRASADIAVLVLLNIVLLNVMIAAFYRYKVGHVPIIIPNDSSDVGRVRKPAAAPGTSITTEPSDPSLKVHHLEIGSKKTARLTTT